MCRIVYSPLSKWQKNRHNRRKVTIRWQSNRDFPENHGKSSEMSDGVTICYYSNAHFFDITQAAIFDDWRLSHP